MAGLGRFILSRLLSTIATLIVAVILISAIFAVYSVNQKYGLAQEAFVQASRELSRQYKDPQLLQRQLQLLKEETYRKLGLTGNYYSDVVRETFSLIESSFKFQFGTSRNQYIGGTNDIGEQIKIAIKNSLILFLSATLINTAIGLVLGLRMARKPGGLLDRVVSIFGMISWSMPVWWIGILFLILFSYYLGWFPLQMKDVYNALAQIPADVNPVVRFFLELKTWLYYMALPLMTLVLVSFGGWAYAVRNIVLETMSQDFVLAARARGLPENRIIYGHVLRTSSPPIVTSIALGLAGAFGGGIITETVFGWPGAGLLYWAALLNGEARLVMALTFVTTVIFLLTIFILDFIYVLLDPRVRTERTQ